MRHWLEDEPAELRAFLASLPKDSLSEHPATELLAAVLGSTTAPMDDRVTERTMRRAVLDEDDELALLAHLLTAMQSRRRGELAPARRQLMLARPILARLEAGLMSTAAPLTTFARAQFALTALAAGELASAHAWIESGPAPTSPPLRSLARLTPALTAMIAAINGDMIAARGSLQRCQHAAPSTGWTAEIADGAAHLASLIIATEEWRFDDAEHLVRSHNPASFGELWPVAYWAHANYLMVRGRDQQALRLAQQALLAEPPGARGDGFARDLLVGTRVEFLIALGELRAAWTLGGEAGEEGPVRTIASIGVLYRSGEFGARFLARTLRNRFPLSIRQSVQVRALEGAAAIAEGDRRPEELTFPVG